MLERIAHAKINLALHVTGQREDGYHLLDSLVVFTQLGDKIQLHEATDTNNLITLKLTGPYSKGLDENDDNLVTRAAFSLIENANLKPEDVTPVVIILEKSLPIASGIGGGSADAAATLLALREFWKLDVDLEPVAAKLGADVPMCLHSKPLRATGIGDEITLLAQKNMLNMVLVNPNAEVSTPQIFDKLENKNNSPIDFQPINTLPETQELFQMRNDLQVPAIALCPSIGAVLEVLKETDCTFFRMSGSGATCFALYESIEKAHSSAERIHQTHPNWWCKATQTTLA